MKNVLMCLLTMCLFAVSARAADLTLFNRLVQVQRDQDGKLVQLKLKAPAARPEISLTAGALVELQSISVRDAELSAEMEQMISAWTADQQSAFRAGHQQVIAKTQLAAALQDNVLNQILLKLEAALNKVFVLNVLAAPNQAGYFQQRTQINAAIQEALNLAGSVNTGFAVAQFLINRTADMMQEKRDFVQNILLHYFEQYPAADLGFTAEEVALLKSSIYEAHLGWQNIPGYAEAKKNWPTYGTYKFAYDETNDAARLKKYSTYAQVYQSLNFAFTPVSDAHSNLIVNTLDYKSRIDPKLSIAYDSSNPSGIKDFRTRLQLEQIGLQLAPIPGIARQAVSALIDSQYVPQKTTEGSLYAALALSGHASEATVIAEQTINPFIVQLLK